jgi:ABC-2 type transport system permease protein
VTTPELASVSVPHAEAPTPPTAAAMWYLTITSARNRLKSQAARLRQPRYLVALVLGIAYLYWALGAGMRDEEMPFSQLAAKPQVPLIVSAVLLLTSARWWLARADRTALAFTPAEVHLLFPAPISRRALVHTKLLRGQAAILLNVVIWVVLLRGGAATIDGWQRGLALWVLFSTFTLHRLAAALVRLNASQHAGAGRRRAIVPLVIFAAMLTTVGGLLWQARPALSLAWSVGAGDVARVLGETLQHPAARVALAPVQALVGPVFATSPTDWLQRIGPALLVLALHYLWVVRTDAAFEEAAVEASQERLKALARMQGTSLDAKRSKKGGVARTLPLPTFGHPAVAVAWKNATAAIRGGGWLKQIGLFFVLFAGTIGLLRWSTGMPTGALIGLTSVWGVMLMLLGPQWTRFDLRLDLRDLTSLRTLPLSGRAIVTAEVVGVSLLHAITVFAFLAVPVLFATFDPTVRADVLELTGAPWPWLVALLLLVPAINLLTFTVQNGLALLYPAWVQLGTDRRGFEAMGQTMLTMGITLVGGAVALVFPLVLGAALWFIARPWAGGWAPVVGAAAGVAILLAEVIPVWMALGSVLDRTEPGDVPGQLA